MLGQAKLYQVTQDMLGKVDVRLGLDGEAAIAFLTLHRIS